MVEEKRTLAGVTGSDATCIHPGEKECDWVRGLGLR